MNPAYETGGPVSSVRLGDAVQLKKERLNPES